MLPTVMSTEKLPMSESPAVSRVRRRSIIIYCGLILQNSIDSHLDVSYDDAGHISSIEAWYKYWPRMLLFWPSGVMYLTPQNRLRVASLTGCLIESTSQSWKCKTQTVCRFSSLIVFMAIDLRVGRLRYRPCSSVATYDAARMHIILI